MSSKLLTFNNRSFYNLNLIKKWGVIKISNTRWQIVGNKDGSCYAPQGKFEGQLFSTKTWAFSGIKEINEFIDEPSKAGLLCINKEGKKDVSSEIDSSNSSDLPDKTFFTVEGEIFYSIRNLIYWVQNNDILHIDISSKKSRTYVYDFGYKYKEEEDARNASMMLKRLFTIGEISSGDLITNHPIGLLSDINRPKKEIPLGSNAQLIFKSFPKED